MCTPGTRWAETDFKIEANSINSVSKDQEKTGEMAQWLEHLNLQRTRVHSPTPQDGSQLSTTAVLEKKKSDNLCSEIHKSKTLIPENKISHFLKTQITKIEAEGSYAFIESGVWD